jgi:protein-tyrosine-phosphatase
MAAAYLESLARGRAKALSAGTQPGEKVNPVVVKAMAEEGIDISTKKPRLLTMEMVQLADKVISMGCGADAAAACPSRIVPTEDWPLDDPHNRPLEEVRKIRDEIKTRIRRLIEEEL